MELSELFPENYVLDGAHKLKSFTFCSELKVRALFTSDNFYPWNKLPLDFQFKAPAGSNKKEFEKQFVWTCIPSVDPELMEKYLKESSPIKPAISEDSQEDTNSMFRNSDMNMDNIKDGKYNIFKNKFNSDIDSKHMHDEYEDSKHTDKNRPGDKTMTKSELAGLYGQKGMKKSDKELLEDEDIDESKLSDEPENGYKSKKLAVDPIMKLDYVIGYTGTHLKWSPNINDKTVLYASGGLLVAMSVGKDQETNQRFFMGHTDIVSCFCFSMDGYLIASAQDGDKPTIRIWDYETGKTFAVIHPKLTSIQCLSFNCDRSLLAASGKDDKNKETITIWHVSVLNANSKPIQVTRQISNFNIIAMKFSPIDPFVIMTCGRENIRSWRLKNDHLQGASIVLDHRARNTIFTDLDYEFGFKSSDLVENESLGRIFVSSKTGLIMLI